MGRVFVAEHIELKKKVAVKVIHEGLAERDEVLARFAREAAASARVDHPNIVTTTDYGALPEGGAYMVTLLVRGPTLAEHLAEHGPLSWRTAVEIAAQLADALAAVHDVRVVHRDLKPSNVLLERRSDGTFTAKLLDFGVAQVRMEDVPDAAAPEEALTRLGTVVGTPGYMAPEQAMGEPVSEATDLYGVGLLLWEMLVGTKLFPEEELTAIVTRQLTEEQTLTGSVKAPPALARLVKELLRRDPKDRPKTAVVVRDSLRRIAYGGTEELAKPQPVVGRHRGFLPAAVLAAIGSLTLVVGVSALAIDEEPVAAAPTKTLAEEPPRTRAERRRAERAERAERHTVSTGVEAPSEIDEKIATAIEGRRSRDQRDAAEWLRAQPEGEVPAYALAIADYRLARSCNDKRSALTAVGEAGDPSGRPLLERITRARTRGCGFLSLSDCYSCERSTARRALEMLPAD